MNFLSIRVDPRIPLVIPWSYRTHIYRAYIDKIRKIRYNYALNKHLLPGVSWVGDIDTLINFISVRLYPRLP